ncbi:hypothetical protein RZS08_11360, partial [Arthrospira platensis SPKY1]|nr:hypothetical protein [Arthrospira platensis SPKY1]
MAIERHRLTRSPGAEHHRSVALQHHRQRCHPARMGGQPVRDPRPQVGLGPIGPAESQPQRLQGRHQLVEVRAHAPGEGLAQCRRHRLASPQRGLPQPLPLCSKIGLDKGIRGRKRFHDCDMVG